MPSDFFWMSYARRRRPQMSTLSTVPPSLLTTDRYLSSEGATVRSGSRPAERRSAAVALGAVFAAALHALGALGGHLALGGLVLLLGRRGRRPRGPPGRGRR